MLQRMLCLKVVFNKLNSKVVGFKITRALIPKLLCDRDKQNLGKKIRDVCEEHKILLVLLLKLILIQR